MNARQPNSARKRSGANIGREKGRSIALVADGVIARIRGPGCRFSGLAVAIGG
jgi:hypothetical protein